MLQHPGFARNFLVQEALLIQDIPRLVQELWPWVRLKESVGGEQKDKVLLESKPTCSVSLVRSCSLGSVQTSGQEVETRAPWSLN